MRCGAARKHLYLLRKPGSRTIGFPVQAEAAEADAHVTDCAACQEFFAAEDGLKNFLKSHAPREKASAALREQVLNRIALERRLTADPSERFSHRILIVALVLLLVMAAFAGGLWLKEKRAREMPHQLASILIDDHIHNVPGVMEVSASDHKAVQSWFQEKLDFAFHLPPSHDKELIGGRLCNLEGRHAALILYEHPQSRVSLIVFDNSNFELPEDRLIAIDGKRCFVETQKGYNVVLWKERGLFYGLISDIRSADLLQLAAQF